MADTDTVGHGMHYAIFLRGVNVNGITVRMADLRDELATLPVEDVATVLASGNVTCSSRLGASELKLRVEEALRRRFGYEAWVIVVDGAALAAIVASVPRQPALQPADGGRMGAGMGAGMGAATGPRIDLEVGARRSAGRAADAPGEAAGIHTYVTLFTGTAELEAFLGEARGPGEQPAVLAGRTAVAWFSPKGQTTDVPVAKLLGRARYASTSTTRNINTLEKVLRLLP